MKLFLNLERKHYFLLVGWLLINILQSAFTNLQSDEAYYWMYSKHLDWGFFDHPPMAAFLIFLGDSLMHNELGVRLFVILLSTLTMAMIMNELNEKKDLFFLSLFILSFPLVHTHIGGFIALPDTPLVFFTILFFIGYKKFVNEPNLKMALLMAFAAAAMIYSKYHAFLVLGLVVLSNLKLLKNKYFWITVVVTVLLLTPHVLWQIENHFPTFKYHLISRTKPVRFWTVQNNIISQLLVAGPLTCLIVFFSLSKFRTNGDLYRKAIIFSILGFYIFFFVMSFKNRIEAHYTTVITPLLMVAAYPIISNNTGLKKWFTRLALPVVIIFFLFRFYLAADFIPNFGEIKIGFYNRDGFSKQIQKMSNGKRVAFFNNYAVPGTYEFYTGQKCIHLATSNYRYSQFDLWHDESYGENDSLFVVEPTSKNDPDKIILENGKSVKIFTSQPFQSLVGLKIKILKIELSENSLILTIQMKNLAGKTIFLDHPSQPEFICMQDTAVLSKTLLQKFSLKKNINPGEEFEFSFSLPAALINTNKSMKLFTQTIENNRGEMNILSKKQILLIINQ